MIVFGIIIFRLASDFYSSIHYSFIYSGVPPTAYEDVLVEHILQIRTVISNFAMLLMFTLAQRVFPYIDTYVKI